MKQFIFDNEDMRKILALAYRHGFVEGLEEKKEEKHGRLSKQVNRSSRKIMYGDILDGKEPWFYI